MTAPHIVDPAGLLGEGGIRTINAELQSVINALLSADADGWSVRSTAAPAPTASLNGNGYRHRDLTLQGRDHRRRGPQSRGTYSRSGSLSAAKRAESALITVVADCYLAGVSTRRMDKLVTRSGSSFVQVPVSGLAADLSERRVLPPPPASRFGGTFTFVAADALTMKVREGGRVIQRTVLIAPASAATATAKSWPARVVATSRRSSGPSPFVYDLVARGLSGSGWSPRRPCRAGQAIRRTCPVPPGSVAGPPRREPDERDPNAMWPAVRRWRRSA